ncbi:MAG: bifunctional metallophosphatase/5'-nucleotidase [Deltaproteobacteria bacterium]|nr:bifunctional metallophosphatase/5'-nucleotidase [Deltaproteobacteria bacterium]
MNWTRFVAFVLAAGVWVGCSDNHHTDQSSVKIAVMTTADLQSCIVSREVVSNGKTLTVGGLARIASAAKQIRSEVDGALLVSSGDDLLGSFYRMFQGEPEMEGMSLAGYEVATPGNHEFDYGTDMYKQALTFAQFDLVSANLIVDDADLSSRILPYVIKEVAGVSIGIFGMMTPEFSLLCNPIGGGVRVSGEIIPLAQGLVDELRGGGCDLIIGLTHIGYAWASKLAQNVTGIDIIVDGQDRQPVHETVKDTIIIQEGPGGEYLGVLRFTVEGGFILNPTWQRILIDAKVGHDPEIQALMEGYVSEYEHRLGQQIGDSTVDLDGRKDRLRSGETNLGDLVADSWRGRFADSDVATVNAGSIRGDAIYPAGPISYLTVNEMLPYWNELVRVEMLGSHIKEALEVSASAVRIQGDGCADGNRASTGGFLQVSGLRITIDFEQPGFCAVYSGREISEILNPGSRIVKAEVWQEGFWVPLDPAEAYTVLVNDYIAEGGDGHYIFLREDLKKTLTTTTVTDILADYVIQHTPISPGIDGRILYLNGLDGLD